MNEEESYKTLTMWFTAGFIAVIFVTLIVLYVYQFYI